MGYGSAQTSGALAGRGGSNGRVFLTRAQNSGEETTPREGRSMVTTNPFRARLTARQAQSPGEDALICQKEPEVSREEVQRFIGKLRWDEQEALLQKLSRESGRKESDTNF